MKNPSIYILVIVLFFLSGCSMKEVINPTTGELNSSSSDETGSTGGTGNTGGSSTTNSTSYQPVSKGSTWTYTVQGSGVSESSTVTMTGDVKNVNNTVYYKATETSSDGPADGYFGHNGNIYYKYDDDDPTESPYLDDSKPAGASFSKEVTAPDGTMKTTVTIVEKGITKTVAGKTFKDVIHTRVEVQFTPTGPNPAIGNDATDYYIAKGVGFIQMEAYLDNLLLLKETLVSYTIK